MAGLDLMEMQETYVDNMFQTLRRYVTAPALTAYAIHCKLDASDSFINATHSA